MTDGYKPLTEALVRAAQRGDWSLARLLRFADIGFAPAISLLVGGRWIEGILSTEEDWADRLDADVDAGIGWASARTAAEFGPISAPAAVPQDAPMVGDIEQFRQTVRQNNFRQFVDDRRAVEAALAQRVEALGDDEELTAEEQREIDALSDPPSTHHAPRRDHRGGHPREQPRAADAARYPRTRGGVASRPLGRDPNRAGRGLSPASR